jgi:hypothetical protein
MQQQAVAVAGNGHRQDERLAGAHGADGGDQGVVEDGVRLSSFGALSFGQPSDAGAWRDLQGVHGGLLA